MSRSPPLLRHRDCWWFVGVLSVVYLLGVQWGLHMAHTEEVAIAWTSLWESYTEPVFETVYNLEEGSLAFMKLAKGSLHSRNKRQLWEPEIPRFEEPTTLKLPKPIINVGFPKAGTSSLFSFFHCNGLKGQHWYCCEPQHHPAGTQHQRLMSHCILDNLIENHRATHHLTVLTVNTSRPRKFLLEGCGDYDFYSEINGPRMFQSNHYRILRDDGTLLTRTQSKRQPRLILPQHHYLEELHDQFPNATFLLNLRPTQQWVDSVMRWGTTLRQEIPNEFLEQDQTRGFTAFRNANNATLQHYGIDHFPPQTVADLNSTLAYIMEHHSNYVRDYVRRHPSHTLIEVDITRNETGQILADAFGLQETCWQHRNQNNKSNISGRDVPGGRSLNFLQETYVQKVRLRQQLAQQKRAEMSGGMFQMFSRVFGNDRKVPEELPMDVGEFERTSMRPAKGMVRYGTEVDQNSNMKDTPAFSFAASVGNDLEIYNVGDSDTEARLARKELYRQRLSVQKP